MRLLLYVFKQKAHFPRGVFEMPFRIIQQFIQGFHIDTVFHSPTSPTRKIFGIFSILSLQSKCNGK